MFQLKIMCRAQYENGPMGGWEPTWLVAKYSPMIFFSKNNHTRERDHQLISVRWEFDTQMTNPYCIMEGQLQINSKLYLFHGQKKYMYAT